MSLREQLAKVQAQEREAAARRANPELEARLEKFVADNPQLRDHYLAMGGKEVVRRMMLARMARAETADRRNRELEQWVNENPDITAKVEERVKATVPRTRPRAAISAVQAQATNQTMRGPRLGL
jgi:hypothetical protein